MVQQVGDLGTAWSEIVSSHLPGRTALAAKNRYVILDRRGESGIHLSSESIQDEGSVDNNTASAGFSTPPPLEMDTAMTGAMAAPRTDLCATNGEILDCSWYDAGLSSSVSDMGVTQNAHWTSDPFSDILCRHYMTLWYPADELSNEASPFSTVDLPGRLPTDLGASSLESPMLGLDFDCFHPVGGPSSHLQEMMFLPNKNPTDSHQLDMDMGFFLGNTNFVVDRAKSSHVHPPERGPTAPMAFWGRLRTRSW